MRSRIACAVLLSALLYCPTTAGQEPVRVPSETVVVPAPPPSSDPVILENTASPGWLAAQILLGQQIGIRGQFTVAERGPWTYVAEGFYGLLFTKMCNSEGAGVGGRALYSRASRDGRNSLLLGPGVNLFCQFERDGVLMLAPSLDLSWLHGFGVGGGWEIGLSAGIGIGLTGNSYWDDTASGRVTPLISVFSGFRF